MPASPRVLAVSAVSAAAVVLSLGVAGVAYASGGNEDAVPACKDFHTQQDAQIALEANVLDLIRLDIELGGAENGIACDKPIEDEDEPDHETDFDDKDCADFDSQEDAQKVLDEDEDDPHHLDADNDGVACESLLEDDDASNDDDDEEKSDSDKSDDSDDSDDDNGDEGGQVKVHPKGGVDTGGWDLGVLTA
jgi:hypothetical protein